MKVEEYRGVTLMSTLYKVYMGLLAERVKEEMKGKGILPGNQTGFRKVLGTLMLSITYKEGKGSVPLRFK